MHGNTVQLFRSSFHSPARAVFHYMQVIAACDLHAFLSVQQMLTSLYRVQESDVFHYVVQVTTRKSQDIRARNIFHYVVQATTCKSQQFIDIRTRHLTKHTKITLIANFVFMHFNNFVNIHVMLLKLLHEDKKYILPFTTHPPINLLTILYYSHQT